MMASTAWKGHRLLTGAGWMCVYVCVNAFSLLSFIGSLLHILHLVLLHYFLLYVIENFRVSACGRAKGTEFL